MKLLVNGMDGSAPEASSKDDVDLDLMMDPLTLDNPPPPEIDLVSNHPHHPPPPPPHTHTHTQLSCYISSASFEFLGCIHACSLVMNSGLLFDNTM